VLLEEIQEIAELLAPKLFGKPYAQLGFAEAWGKLKTSELFHCCMIAQAIRLDAVRAAEIRYNATRYSWPEIMGICEEIIAQPERLQQQKEELQKRGYLKTS